MHQMVTTVKNTESASQVKTLAQESRDAAEKGSDVMSSMISMMSAITESSLHISRITNIIDSIAFQTNILALNAAVEAAGPENGERLCRGRSRSTQSGSA
jgi:methyl-accepting chemotaxis protein